MISLEQKEVFNTVIQNLNKSGLLQHVMIVGSWAEYIYESSDVIQNYFSSMRTRDVDFLIMNLRKPPQRTPFLSVMKERGFDLVSDSLSGVSRFVSSDDSMEIEFLIHEMGRGQSAGYHVEALGISVEGLRHLNVLRDNPLSVEHEGYWLIVPKPEAYIMHKVIINEKRTAEKRNKDIEAVNLISEALYLGADSEKSIKYTQDIWKSLTKKERATVVGVIEKNGLSILKKVLGYGSSSEGEFE